MDDFFSLSPVSLKTLLPGEAGYVLVLCLHVWHIFYLLTGGGINLSVGCLIHLLLPLVFAAILFLDRQQSNPFISHSLALRRRGVCNGSAFWLVLMATELIHTGLVIREFPPLSTNTYRHVHFRGIWTSVCCVDANKTLSVRSFWMYLHPYINISGTVQVEKWLHFLILELPWVFCLVPSYFAALPCVPWAKQAEKVNNRGGFTAASDSQQSGSGAVVVLGNTC